MRIHSALVVVVGLGGVGSHAATMLLRSGVGRLRIVDFDQVRTTEEGVGRSSTRIWVTRLIDLWSQCGCARCSSPL